MPTRRADWPADIRERALALYVEHGPAEASRQTGVPIGTVAAWAHRKGVQSNAPDTLARAREALKLTREVRVAQLAEDLLVIAQERAKRLRQSITADSERELATVIGLAIDKSQLLAGAATSRIEHIEAEQLAAVDNVLQMRRTAA